MTIEFHCNQCNQLLRVPDTGAGKRARCPACGQTVDVPSASGGPAATPPTPPDNPFADRQSAGHVSETGSSVNPYAAPSPLATPSKTAGPLFGATGVLQHQQIGFGETLQRAWDIFKTQVGPCLLLGVILVACHLGVGAIAGTFRAIATVLNEEVMIIIGVIIQQVINLIGQTFLQLGAILFTLKLARWGQADYASIFHGGPYLLRGIGFTLLLYLIFLGIAAVCVGPGLLVLWATDGAEIGIIVTVIGGFIAAIPFIYVALQYYLTLYFIADHNQGILDAMKSSSTFMAGNKLVALALMLVVGVLGTLFMCLTCFIGVIAYVPYFVLLTTAIYLLASGQVAGSGGAEAWGSGGVGEWGTGGVAS